MSAETTQWLNDNIYYGCAATRSTWGAGTSFGNGLEPWFATAEYKHLYQGFIPVEDIINGLFYWEPTEANLFIRVPVASIEVADGVEDDGTPYRVLMDPDRKAIIRPDTQDILGVFGKKSYQVHTYEEWLINNVARLLDADLGISSAGLLRKGGQAWLTIELPEDMEVEGAGHIRPCIIAGTSCDGTLATTYATRTMRPECDNSLRLSLNAKGNTMKVKHSSKSMGKLDSARQALGLIYKVGEEAAAFFDALAKVDITDHQFQQIIAGIAPVPTPEVKDAKVSNQRSITIAENKQFAMKALYNGDQRAKPWNGTLAGAFHAVNTFQQHILPQDANPVRRMMTGTMMGGFDKAEDEFWGIVNGLGIKLPEMVTA